MKKKKDLDKNVHCQLNTLITFFRFVLKVVDCYLPTQYFVSVLPVWYDVIELIDEPPQISHLVGFLSVETEGLGVRSNEDRKWHSLDVSYSRVRPEDDLVMANGQIGLKYRVFSGIRNLIGWVEPQWAETHFCLTW